tara:strand:- start:203 stop:709 length:507 start_codon:yes stop_codon:yes gene_type:complete
MPNLLYAIYIAVLVILSGSVDAHEQKSSITVVLANKNSGLLEISHRFNIHDAEHALTQLFGGKTDIINDPDTQARFSDYIQGHFSLRISDQLPIGLSYIGHEVDGKFFWVYQEAPLPPSTPQIQVFANALQSVWKRQTNLVNFEGLGSIQSLRFTLNTEWQTVHFNHP